MMNQQRECRVEVFSRVTGFFQPVQLWNKGKQEEFGDRGTFEINKQQKEHRKNEVQEIKSTT
jgi:hypothetical protein